MEQSEQVCSRLRHLVLSSRLGKEVVGETRDCRVEDCIPEPSMWIEHDAYASRGLDDRAGMGTDEECANDIRNRTKDSSIDTSAKVK